MPDRNVENILLIDDDRGFAAMLVEQMKLHDAFAMIHVRTAAEGLEKLRRTRYDAVLLDIGLPDMDGRDLCRKLRQEGVRAPVVMLADTPSDADTVLALEAGANDYVTKPFRINVLLARLRAHLREYEHSVDAILSVGPYDFHPAAKMLVDKTSKKKVRLADKETSALKFLCRAGDRAVGRGELLAEVWGYNAEIVTHTIETHIYRLRIKIEKNPANPKILVSEHGGYRLLS